MKKILVMLTFLIGCSAGMMGQVTIGSADDPHPGAVLDLKSTSQGLLLPRIALTGAADFLIEGSDKDAAKGMLVYNTSDKMDGPGLYVWTGTAWRSFAAVDCPVPTKPLSITFSPALTNTIAVNTLLTTTAGVSSGGTSYAWTVPAGFEIIGETTTKSISLRAKQTGDFNAAQITVKAVNSCGESETIAGTGTIAVAEPSSVPAIPTLTLPVAGTSLNPGDQFTITCGDVGADSYIWTLPAGITAASTTTTTNAITVTVTEGIYEANTITVKAHNSIGDSDGTFDVTIRCEQPGNYNGSDIKVKVTNDCGSLNVSGSGTFKVLESAGAKSEVVGFNGAYTAYKYPNGLGTWMTQNSKEGNPTYKTYPGKTEGERGYYYLAAEANQGCPDGWVLPTPAQFDALWAYFRTLPVINEHNEDWLAQEVFAGLGSGTYWNQVLFLLTSELGNRDYRTTPAGSFTTATNIINTHGKSVRCIKNSCDDAPQVNFSYRFIPVAPINGIDTIKISYSPIGLTTATWNMQAGAEILSSTDTTVVLKYTTPGMFDWSSLSCTVSNACGSTTLKGSGSFTVLNDAGSPGADLVIGGNRYKTYTFPNSMGTWMIENLRELPAALPTSPNRRIKCVEPR